MYVNASKRIIAKNNKNKNNKRTPQATRKPEQKQNDYYEDGGEESSKRKYLHSAKLYLSKLLEFCCIEQRGKRFVFRSFSFCFVFIVVIVTSVVVYSSRSSSSHKGKILVRCSVAFFSLLLISSSYLGVKNKKEEKVTIWNIYIKLCMFKFWINENETKVCLKIYIWPSKRQRASLVRL